MRSWKTKEIPRFVFPDLVDSDINQKISGDALVLTILDSLIHRPLKTRVIRLLPHLMAVLPFNSRRARRIVIKVSHIET